MSPPVPLNNLILDHLFFNLTKTMIWSYLSLLSLIAFFDNVASHPAFSGKLIERSTDLSPSYDYIIVGGGTSGLVVANRLSENPSKHPDSIGPY